MAFRFIAQIAALSVALLVAGCAAYPQFRALTTEAEAIATHGEPARRHDNGDGTTTLEYSTQPYGDTALMVTVDRSGVVIEQHDALAYETLAKVEPGMTQDEVSRLLGTHRSVQRFELSGEEVWDWNIRNDGPGIATLFNVHFVDGKVVRTSRTYIFPNDGLFGSPFYDGLFYSYRPFYGYPYPSWRSRWPYWRRYPWYW